MKILHKFTLHKDLKSNQLKKIIDIKRLNWKYTKAEHKEWADKNLKNNDIHVETYVNRKLAGYTALRLKSLINKKFKKNKYYYFDTHVVSNEFRGKKICHKSKVSDLHMNKIKEFLIKKNKSSMLLCKKSKFKYYKNNGWQRIYKSMYELSMQKNNLYAYIYPKQEKLLYTKFYL